MPYKLNCPELEIRYASSDGPFESELNYTSDTSVDLLDIYSRDIRALEDSNVFYRESLGHDELVGVLGSKRNPLLRILFFKASYSTTSNVQGMVGLWPTINSSTAEYLIRKLGVSPAFMAVITTKTWVTKTGNCFWRRQTSHGEAFLEGWYRYSCGLKGPPSHVWFSYHEETGSTTYILNNCEFNGVQDSILRCIKCGSGDRLLRPLVVDAFIAEATAEAWGSEILHPRMTLVEYEYLDGKKMRMDQSETVKELHVLSYNFLIIKEDMTDLVERLEYLIKVHESLEGTLPQAIGAGIPVSQSLSFLLSQTRIRIRWVQSYANRIGIQINLYYNLSSQRDNRTNLAIADFTSKIATETQKDSSSMITMATVTMVFLPGTFVSAVFSMVFFNTQSGPNGSGSIVGLSVTRGWWLYPLITIPLTILVFMTWNIWRTRRNNAQIHDLQQPEGYNPTALNRSSSPDPFLQPQSVSTPGLPHLRSAMQNNYSSLDTGRSALVPQVQLGWETPMRSSNTARMYTIAQPAFTMADMVHDVKVENSGFNSGSRLTEGYERRRPLSS